MCKLCEHADTVVSFVESLMDERTQKELEDDIGVPEKERSKIGCVLATIGSALAEYGFRNEVHPAYLMESLVRSYNKRVIALQTGQRKSESEKKLEDYES